MHNNGLRRAFLPFRVHRAHAVFDGVDADAKGIDKHKRGRGRSRAPHTVAIYMNPDRRCIGSHPLQHRRIALNGADAEVRHRTDEEFDLHGFREGLVSIRIDGGDTVGHDSTRWGILHRRRLCHRPDRCVIPVDTVAVRNLSLGWSGP